MNESENFESAEQPAASPWTAPESAEQFGEPTEVVEAAANDEATADDVNPVGETETANPQRRSKRLGRTLAVAGAVTAVGAAIGMAIGVAADGHHESRQEVSTSAEGLPPVSAASLTGATTNRAPAPAGGQWDGHDFDGGRGGFDGRHEGHRGGPGGDRQVSGRQRSNGPVGAQPGQAPASASHGS